MKNNKLVSRESGCNETFSEGSYILYVKKKKTLPGCYLEEFYVLLAVG